MWIERVFLGRTRQTKTTFVPANSSRQIEGDSTRVHARICWQFPEAASPGNGRITIQGKNNIGTTLDVNVATITEAFPVDDIDAQDFGDLLTRQFIVINDSLTSDLMFVETVYR